ncbi:4-hydroxy-tetrahydrodipicolinate reductase [Candidatus Methylacidithermus pantelleriae]|uniref:4-hydroxy-tetrahydrodipicolinate reductase n=1 Tax=Candidatus Methylacidithermus pantelleriae TaxID=2744239 RepID=A0A8J2FNC4_9BACT|nr:4-hydroxy-tetrahydrodipicolinate reductase [Candidatus Methylacidithermus pantelleriae]CAF0694943.1 4-hydroxy-tetrahydrodipicolinate reductase [Candidatus Methylacidithermus pantelleriae]
MNSPIQLGVFGAKGKMGQEIVRLASSDPRFTVVAQLDRGDDPLRGFVSCDVIIDFSHPSATASLVEACVALDKALVSGTTGHTSEEKATIRDAAQKIPILHAPNFSLGVMVLGRLVQEAARWLLGEGYEVEIVELHHRNKLDAPSGTACRLAEMIGQSMQRQWQEMARFGRAGQTGPRSKEELGMHSLRGGDVIGEHTVLFLTEGERLELSHKAWSRAAFASGALKGALWIRNRPAGLYSIEDMLGSQPKSSF